MNEQDAFLQAICESPHDDAPRLIFADWLEDHGEEERASFIRQQIESARLQATNPERKQRAKAEKALLRKFVKKWFNPPRGWKVGAEFQVRRGFPESADHWGTGPLENTDWFSRWPITRLRMARIDRERASAYASWSFLARIEELDLHSHHVGPDIIGIVLSSPHLAGLVRLNVGGNKLGDAGVRHLAELPHLAGVRELDIRHNEITAAGMQHLLRSPYRKAITSLNLCGNRSILESSLPLLESPSWPALTELILWYTSLDDDGVEKLAACSGLSKLTSLNLSNNSVGDNGLRALARSPHAANLRTLLLPLNRLTAASVPVLIESPYLQGLTLLNLYNNSALSSQARRKLRKHFGDRLSFDQPW